jgi:hypothetical protein
MDTYRQTAAFTAGLNFDAGNDRFGLLHNVTGSIT